MSRFPALDIILNQNAVQVSLSVAEVGQNIIQLSQSSIDDQELADWLKHISVYG